ncbi:MAG: TRAP transporter fused permease subunit [Deltaproteobacteria bacterium]|nr:TRAP transporter fused permease subunit [Deltaproteobacteria bacterium]
MKERRRRASTSIPPWAGKGVLIALSLFQIYVAIVGVMTPLVQRSIHLSLGLSAAFLVYSTTKNRKPGTFSLLLAILSALVALYPTLNFEFMTKHVWLVEPLGEMDLTVGALSILLILEACRRCAGVPFMLLCSALVAYPCLPLLIGPIFGFPGFSPVAVIDWMYFTLEGIFGVSLGVSTTAIFPFILLGAFLERVGITDFFVDLAKAAVGSFRGGPAKISVISSALFGTVSGSAVANVMVDGQFTIPTMVKAGYSSETAAAVEAVASTGGYITPPVMGAVAFLMAEIIGVSYWTIAFCAVFPALLYYLALFLQVHMRACTLNLAGIPKDQLPSLKMVLKKIYYLFPLGLLVYLLSVGYSIYTSCVAAIAATLPIGFILKTERMTLGDVLSALESGAKNSLLIIVTCAAAGFILGSMSLTGLAVLLCSLIIKFSMGSLLGILVLSMFVNILMGMGVGSPIASYLALAGTTLPAAIQLGVNKIAAHMFTIYFANISFITPPVAMAVFAAAALAKSNIWRTGWIAVRLGIAGFVVPYMFVFDPALLLIGSTTAILKAVAIGVLAVTSLSMGFEGWVFTKANKVQRALMVVGALFFIIPGIVSEVIGGMLVTFAVLLNLHAARRTAVLAPLTGRSGRT